MDMMEPAAKETSDNSQPTARQMDAARLASYRILIAHLPVTMRPSLNQQLSKWESLFPFEQEQLVRYMRGLESFSPSALETLIEPLKSVEIKMGVAQWNFSQTGDTMENASLLARSEYYADWRREVERIFEAVNTVARNAEPSSPNPARLVLIVLPKSLPVDPLNEWKPWDPRATDIKISGDSSKLSELIIQGGPDRPGVARILANQGSTDSSDLWLIDADAEFEKLLAPSERQSSCSLSYSTLKPFRDRFLAQVNTVPKSIEGTDQTLDAMRHDDWGQWWPSELAGKTRLRSFVIDLFLSGNGALIFSNAFVEWAASEVLRRARPRVVVARFGLRSRPKPFTGIAIFENQQRISTLPDVDDPSGSAADAAILARYIWLAAMRYQQQNRTSCLCISEYHNAAYLIAPDSPPWRQGDIRSQEEVFDWISAHLIS
jgi:hypothetical protein